MFYRVIFLLLLSPLTFAASLPPVSGKSCMVVSAQHYATEVGLDILRKGGNAIDAAVAMGYALAVVYPCCGNIGGGGFMLIHLANGKNTFLNFREKAPSRLTPSVFLDAKGNVASEKLISRHVGGKLNQPYLSVAVPGTVMGLNTALQKYGTLDLSTVIKPAIHLARNGFTLLPGDIEILQTGTTSFKTQKNVSAIFLKNDQAYESGDTLQQLNLAATLEEIAKNGSTGFYHGKIATEMVKASQAEGGVLELNDLATYTVQELKPLVCTYRGYTIITSPPPSSGGVTICETLNILENYLLKQLGFHSAAATHITVEAMKHAFADRNRYLGDPDFVKNPIQKLISKEYAAKIDQQIAKDKATDSAKIGFMATNEGHNTTAYVVADKAGNAVSVTYTLNDYFGAKIIAGNTGFFLNNEIGDFTIKPGVPNSYKLVQGEANRLQPGKRPLSSMAPTFITKNGRLELLMGTPGGSTIPTQLVSFIQNVIDFGMNIQEAENAPRFHMQWLPDYVYMEPFTFSRDTREILESMGHKFQLGSPYHTLYWGSIAAIAIDSERHQLLGAIDARRPTGSAMGE